MAIHPYTQVSLRQRLEAHAARAWAARCKGVHVTFRGAHAYVAAFVEDTWFLPETTEEEKARIRATPVPLCRLTWRGDPEAWLFAFHQASHDRYEPAVLPDGSTTGSPEACFDCAAGVYLQDGW